MIRTSTKHARRGFTLVELMVSAAVCVLIMAILATVFQQSIDLTRQMKSTGDLMTQLRASGELIKRDLRAKHFTSDNSPTGRQRVSDQELDALTVSGTAGNFTLGPWIPPQGGFFRIKSTPSTSEGTDADGLASTRATDHYLHFTSVLELSDDAPYLAQANNGQKYSRLQAEIAYFLDPVSSGTTGGTSPTPLYQLIRRQRLVAKSPSEQLSDPLPAIDPGVISVRPTGPNQYAVNTMSDLTNPVNRLGQSVVLTPTASGSDTNFAPLSSRAGDDILISNVISFEVKVQWTAAADATGKLPVVRQPRPFGTDPVNESSDNPFDTLPIVPTNGNTTLAGQYVFDTWSSAFTDWNKLNPTTGVLTPSAQLVPLLIRVKAVQIRIRVFDPKLKSTRQMTIVQEL